TSTGVPVIGCGCRVCTSADPRDQRTRCAAYVEAETAAGPVRFVIDTGPDFRQQALREGISGVDAVLFTHHHFDHVVGLDDLRPFFFRNRAPIPCYAGPNTATVLRRMFAYVFADGSYPGVPLLELREVDGPFAVRSRSAPEAAVEVEPVEVFHGTLPMLGYRIGRFAYLTDVSRIPEASLTQLGDLDVLVLDALRREPHPTHFTIDEAVAAAEQVGARRTVFIHMTHNVLHAEEEARLPEGVALGYDGLTLEVGG
ncbi:MAG: MBL fold metallo-hydrolase, partial [Rhodothermales bacterium]|nr:MBL fold metallo-hydrolase [Rhodothermales bacterium]